MSTIQLQTKNVYSNKSRELISMLNDSSVRTRINQLIGDAIQPYVPKNSGDLRDSMYVGPKVISWGRGLSYGQYQFQGEVYGPNLPIMRGGVVIGWYKGKKKQPTGRELGVPGEWNGWKFGYTTSGTQHHWTSAYSGQVKRQTNLQITNMLKAECRARGLNK